MKTVGIVLGRGGHTAQTLGLVDLLGEEYKYVYFIDLLDRLTPSKIRIPGKILPVLAPRLLPQDSKTMSLLRTITTFFLSLLYILTFRINTVISCGTGITIPVFYSAKVTGTKTVYIESISRVTSLSMTGRMLLGKTTLFFTQWKGLANRMTQTHYGGQLI